MRRSAPGRELSRVAGIEREPDPAVVEVDARRRLEQPGAETGRVRLEERHAHAIAVDRADARGTTRCGGRTEPSPAARLDPAAPLPDRLRPQQRPDVGA